MKLLGLDVENYGHYSDQRFDFAAGAADAVARNGDIAGAGGFCLIHGENEAGKTTLLQLLRDVLFGFPPQTPYDFGYKGEVAAVLRAELRDGRTLEVRRRKGRKDVIAGTIDGGGDPLDEAAFLGLLGAGRELYHNVFAFSLEELAVGQKSLETADLTEALYGSGLGGLTRFQNLRDRIRKEHEELFAKQARTRQVNVLLTRLRDDRKELQANIVDPREFERAQAERAEAEAEVERLRSECGELGRRNDALQRNQRCLPGWLKLRVLRDDLAGLELPAVFPVDEVDRYERLQKRLEEIDADVSRLEAELSVQESRAEGADADRADAEETADESAVLEYESQIRELGKDENRIREMLKDLPQRREEARAILEEVARRTRGLDSAWTVADLDRFASSTSDRARLKHLATRHAELDKQLATESRSLRDLELRGDKVRSRLERLQPNERLEELDALVDRAAEYRRRAEQLAVVRKEMGDLDPAVAVQRERLQRQVGGAFDDPALVAVPLAATIDAFHERLRELDERCRRAAQLLEERTAERSECAERVAALDVPGAPPDAATLQAARDARDERWRTLRPRSAGWSPPVDEALDAYEEAIADADSIADERYAHAEDLARREQLDRDLARFERRVVEATETTAAAERERDAALVEWGGVWADCGFSPLAPAAMREWLGDFVDWRANLVRRAELAAEAEQLAGPVEAFEAELSRACPGRNGSAEAALASATRERDADRAIQRERESLAEDLATIEADRRDAERTCRRLTEALEGWERERIATLAALGVPAEWRIDVAQEVLGEVMELLRNRGEAANLEERVAEMESQLATFEVRAADVAEGVGLDGERAAAVGETADAIDPRARRGLEIVGRLVSLVDRVRSERTKQEAFEEARRATTERLSIKRAERAAGRTERDALMQSAGIEDAKRFTRLAEIARSRTELLAEMEETERQLRIDFNAADLETCAAELDGLEEDELGRRLETVRAELDERTAEQSRAAEWLGATKDRLRALDTENRAGEIASRIEGTRSELVEAVDRWAPRVLVERLVTRALERFEREHQPEMLLDVSRLYERMTRGRYVGLERKVFGNGRLIVQQADGTTKEPSHLSTGAREQLYLSIRLAYALRYCRTAEPLPLVMDDVLVNFDAERTRSTLAVLREVSQQVQVLFLTCHRHVVEMIREVVPEHDSVVLTSTGAVSATLDEVSDEGDGEQTVEETAGTSMAGGAGRRGKREVKSPRSASPPLFPES